MRIILSLILFLLYVRHLIRCLESIYYQRQVKVLSLSENNEFVALT